MNPVGINHTSPIFDRLISTYFRSFNNTFQFLGEENMLGESSYKYLTVDEMKSLGDDSMPIDVTHDEQKIHKGEANYQQVFN